MAFPVQYATGSLVNIEIPVPFFLSVPFLFSKMEQKMEPPNPAWLLDSFLCFCPKSFVPFLISPLYIEIFSCFTVNGSLYYGI